MEAWPHCSGGFGALPSRLPLASSQVANTPPHRLGASRSQWESRVGLPGGGGQGGKVHW